VHLSRPAAGLRTPSREGRADVLESRVIWEGPTSVDCRPRDRHAGSAPPRRRAPRAARETRRGSAGPRGFVSAHRPAVSSTAKFSYKKYGVGTDRKPREGRKSKGRSGPGSGPRSRSSQVGPAAQGGILRRAAAAPPGGKLPRTTFRPRKDGRCTNLDGSGGTRAGFHGTGEHGPPVTRPAKDGGRQISWHPASPTCHLAQA